MTGPQQRPARSVPAGPGRNLPVAATAALVVLGLLCVAAGALYLAESAAHLPAFFPGHEAGSAHRHVKHGIAAFVVALLLFGGAWFSTGSRTRA